MRLMRLSPREAEVARLIGEDLSDKEIAQILRISVHTVRVYVVRIVEKVRADDERHPRRRIIRRWLRATELQSEHQPAA